MQKLGCTPVHPLCIQMRARRRGGCTAVQPCTTFVSGSTCTRIRSWWRQRRVLKIRIWISISNFWRMLTWNKNESCPDRKTAIKLFVHNQIITPLYYNYWTATAFVTRKSIQNWARTLRLRVIVILSFWKTFSTFENHNKKTFVAQSSKVTKCQQNVLSHRVLHDENPKINTQTIRLVKMIGFDNLSLIFRSRLI
jgi:hypothetical protein